MIRFAAILFRLSVMAFLWTIAQNLSGMALAEGRHALLVGIDRYDRLDDLQKARNDARAMDQALRRAGFSTTLLEDADQISFLQAIADFSARIEPGDEAVVYFAGHGVEIEGKNYLLPSDTPAADPGSEIVLTARSIAVDALVDALQRRGARLSLLILDACRDNPFPRRGLRSIGGTRGLARASAPEGTYILYSAGERETALDRLSNSDTNPNSVFTRALLPLIAEPGLSLREISTQVRREVRAMAAAVNHAQFPAVYDQLDGDFSFTKGDAARPDRADHCAAARADWPYVETSGSEPALRAFVAAHPGCQVQRALAEAKLASLRSVLSPPAGVAAPQAPTEDVPRDCGLAEAELQKLDRDDPDKIKAFANRWAACAAIVAEARGDARACLRVSAAWTAVDRTSRLALESFLLLYPGCAPQNAMAQARLDALMTAASASQAAQAPDAGACVGVSPAWGAVDRDSKVSVQSFLTRFPDCAPQSATAQVRLTYLNKTACIGVSAAWGAVDRDSKASVQSFLTRFPECTPQSATARVRLTYLNTSASRSAAAANASDYSIRQIAQIRLTLNRHSALPATMRQENLRSLELIKLGMFAKGGLRNYIKNALGKTEAEPKLTKAIVAHILATPRAQADIMQNLMSGKLIQPERSGDWLSGMESDQCRVVGSAVQVSDPLVHMMPAVIGSATPNVVGNSMTWLIAWPMPFVHGRDVIAQVDGRRFAVESSEDGSNIILPRTADGKFVDSALTAAMRRGTSLTLTGTNQETGEPVTFTFSLKGFTAAFGRMAQLCNRPQLSAWID